MGGQTTALDAIVRAEIAIEIELEQTGNAIRIVGDNLRPYHPGFVAHDAVTASRFTSGRQTAKVHLLLLAAALEDYGRTVDFERHQIETRHREVQHRQRQEIRAPSEGSTEILQAAAHERGNRLNAAPQLRRELAGIATSINRRLTPADRNVLKLGDLDGLSRNMTISPERTVALARVQSQMQAVHGQTQLHRQQLERGRNAAISIKR